MENWQKTLATARKQARENEVGSDLFLEFTKGLVSDVGSNTKASVFGSAAASSFQLWGSKPKESEVLNFYNHAVAVRRVPLKLRLSVAALKSTARFSADFAMLAACFAMFVNRRFLAFTMSLQAHRPKWAVLQQKRIENVSRMLDRSTWEFIAYYRAIHMPANWIKLFFYIVRSEYTCVPRKYGPCIDYASERVEEADFNRDAYNHMCGHWPQLQTLLRKLLCKKKEWGELLKSFVLGSCQCAAQAGLRMKEDLPIGRFNRQELLWHFVLLREAFVYNGFTPSAGIVRLRESLFGTCLFGNGGLDGLRVFFPNVRVTTAASDAVYLLRYLTKKHGLLFHEMHCLQWLLCAFQKTLNPGYHRKYTFVIRPASFFVDWHERVASYPAAAELFGGIAAMSRCSAEWTQFLSSAKDVHRSVSEGSLQADTQCRSCWLAAGVPLGVKKRTHSEFRRMHCICESTDKRAKK